MCHYTDYYVTRHPVESAKFRFMMKIEWLLVNYVADNDVVGGISADFEIIKDDKVFENLTFSKSIRGQIKNIGFFSFRITKGCDIRYYSNFSKINNSSIFKNKIVLSVISQIDIFSPSISNIPMSEGATNIINVGSYDKSRDAIQAANDIANGFINSIINGGNNLMFCRESKKLLLENKNEPIFVGRPQLK